jgi:hypothetical protein
MARPLLIELSGGLYRVTARGDRHEAIYRDDAGDWAWSSYPAMLGGVPAAPWLETDWVLGQFGHKHAAAQAACAAFVADGGIRHGSRRGPGQGGCPAGEQVYNLHHPRPRSCSMPLDPKLQLTFEEWLEGERAPLEGRSEYLGGEVFAMTGASVEHNAIVVDIARELSIQMKGLPCPASRAPCRWRRSTTRCSSSQSEAETRAAHPPPLARHSASRTPDA